MTLGVYINMKDQVSEALDFYGEIFGSTCTDMMTYGSIQEEGGPEIDEKNKKN